MDQPLTISARHFFIFCFLHEDSLFCVNIRPNPQFFTCYTVTLKPLQKSASLMKLYYYLNCGFTCHLVHILQPASGFTMINCYFNNQWSVCVRFSVKQKVDLTLLSLAYDCIIMVLMPICLTPHQNVHTKEAFYISKQLFKLNYLLFTFFALLFSH